MQKILFTLFIVSILLLSNCNSQEKSCTKGHCLKGDVGYVSFSIGPSIPLGNFADKDLKNSNSGFANTGSKIDINGGFNIIKSVDLALKLFYSVNSYDISSLTKNLSDKYPGTTWTTSGRSWDIIGGMVGLSYSYPFPNRFVGDFKFQTGVMQTSTPQMTITGNNGTKITESDKSASSFVFLISAGGHYPLGRLVDAIGSIEYLGSSATFSNINRISNLPLENNPGFLTSSIGSTAKQNVSFLSLNFGFRVKF
jgi:hypothetical protein